MRGVPVVLVDVVVELDGVLPHFDPLVQLAAAGADDAVLGLLGQPETKLLPQHGEQDVLEGDFDGGGPESVQF